MLKIKNVNLLTVFYNSVFIFYFSSCSLGKGDFNSRELISSRGEKIYINSYSWGITGDSQLSIISADKERLREFQDTSGAIRGLEPFIYSFNNDSLILFFLNQINYQVKEKFKSITIIYVLLDPEKYYDLMHRAYHNYGYFTVPIKEKVNYPPDMPEPPWKN